MKNRVHVRGELGVGRSLLSSAVLAALATMAQAQTAAPAPAASSASAPSRNVEKLEAVIITGTARSEGLKKLDASFSITTATGPTPGRWRSAMTA